MSENEKESQEITYALDIPSKRDYSFDEFFIDTDEDEIKGINSLRPNTKIWNQGNTPACTCYSATHLYNGCNILEDEKLGENREQQDPAILRERFCIDRNSYDGGTAIQTMANWFKKNKLIEGYVTIPTKDTNKVEKMKKALNNGFFLSTGSSCGDWAKIRQTGVYSERPDGKFVGHAWCIVDWENDYFRAVNSYGDKRGLHNGMFKVPFSMVDKIYSCLVFIDKDDSKRFTALKTKKKIDELLTIAKELYNNGTSEQRKFFEQISLSKRLKELYYL